MKESNCRLANQVQCYIFNKAHLYVIHNTDEIEPYIKRHKRVLETENQGKRIAWLEDEHNKSFVIWLEEEVKRERETSENNLSETVRWISHSPRVSIVKYDAYEINCYIFRTKRRDGKKYQNSGVSGEVDDLYISQEIATTRQNF